MLQERFLWFVGGLAVLLVFVFLQEQVAKGKVKRSLEEKGFRHIQIRTKLFGGSRGTLAFDVRYRDDHGISHRNTCIVRTGILSEDTIDWEKPLR